MMTMQSPSAFVRRLSANRRGLAFTEFALALPVVLTIILYGLETANFGLAILRVHQIAATAADNASRVRDSVNEIDVNEVLLGGKIVGAGMDFASRGRIVLSSVMPNGQSGSNAGQMIFWQRCSGALNAPESQPQYGTQGKGATDGSLPGIGRAGNRIAASANSAMVFAEVTYRYKPLVSDTLLGTPILRSEASFTVRERNSETLGQPPEAAASLCTNYSA